MPQVPQIQLTESGHRRHGEFENRESSTWPQDAMDLATGRPDIDDVPNPEGDRDRVDRSVRNRNPHRVTADQPDPPRLPFPLDLVRADREHRGGEIDADHAR